jgi:AcrR family transcriptional regulator
MSRTSRAASCQKAAKGRPPVYSETERTRRILQAAEQVFTTVGYGAATMEEIARAAGMSKKTLYGLYPDKRHLLAAVTVAAEDFPWEDADRTPLADPVAELRHRLLAATGFALTPRQIRLTRLLISEAEHVPELADNFHDRVMRKCQAYLEAAVERVIEDGGGPEIEDVREMTMALLGAALAELHLLALFGKAEILESRQIAAHVDAALRNCGFKPRQGGRRRSRSAEAGRSPDDRTKPNEPKTE